MRTSRDMPKYRLVLSFRNDALTLFIPNLQELRRRRMAAAGAIDQ
jgi:hypothetical protein